MKMLYPLFALFLLIMAETSQAQVPAEQATLAITIETFDAYYEGFPMIAAVVVHNPTEHASFYRLPPFDIFSAPVPVELHAEHAETGEVVPFDASYGAGGEGPPTGYVLEPGERRRMLIDLANLGPPLSSGRYELRGEYVLPKGSPRSERVPFEVLPAAGRDADIAARLWAINDIGEPSWSNFIRYNWRSIYLEPPIPKNAVAEMQAVDATGLSEEGREALAYHLFLHRATYGPHPLSTLSRSRVDAFADGPLEGEAEVLRYELAAARDGVEAAEIRRLVTERFPGLLWRLDEIDAGRGRLSRLRTTYGAEQDFDREPSFHPYTGP